MEHRVYNSAYYGNITIRARNSVHNNLDNGTVEKLAAVIHGAEEKESLSRQYRRNRGNPGEGAEAYVHNHGSKQIASVKDVNIPPGSITVVNTGKVRKKLLHLWD